MANNSEVTLIHANWCGHCTRYLPKWNDSISSILQENGIQAGQLEQSDSNFESLSKIDGTPVRGFPTLKVKVNNIEKEFNGNRDNAQEIVDFVKTPEKSDLFLKEIKIKSSLPIYLSSELVKERFTPEIV